MNNTKITLDPAITVLDLVSRYRETETVFKRYDKTVGECICCQSLFESLEDVAQKYGLDLGTFLVDLETSINTKDF